MKGISGVVCHHTAGPATGNAPSLGIVTRGRPDLAGPLSQMVLGRDGTYYIVASGRANHAGGGRWRDVTDGNGCMLGIEAEATGRDVWPKVQYDAYVHGVAAILRHLKLGPAMACGHKEYATPSGRKPDPNFDMVSFRQAVRALLADTPPPPPPPVPDKVLPALFPPHILVPIVDAKQAPEGGVMLLGMDGSLYAYGAARSIRGANGQPWWGARRAALLRSVGAPGTARRWEITAHTGETYHLP